MLGPDVTRKLLRGDFSCMQARSVSAIATFSRSANTHRDWTPRRTDGNPHRGSLVERSTGELAFRKCLAFRWLPWRSSFVCRSFDLSSPVFCPTSDNFSRSNLTECPRSDIMPLIRPFIPRAPASLNAACGAEWKHCQNRSV